MTEEPRHPDSPVVLKPTVVPPQSTAPVATTPALTPEEQMALFEKELKEQDWGHQPC